MLMISVLGLFKTISIILFGISFGLSISAFGYTFLVLRSARKDDKEHIVVLPDDVEQLVVKYKDKYNSQTKKSIGAKFNVAIDLSKEILTEIATMQFEGSKFPVYELSIEEVLELNRYITKRLELLFNRKGVGVLKSVRLSQVMYVVDIKNNVTDLKAFKVYSKLGPKVKKGLMLTKVINPFFWVKQIVSKVGIGISTNIVCKEIIHIVAEESYKIYSKSLFTEKVTIDEIEQEMLVQEA